MVFNWLQSGKIYRDKRMMSMIGLGFSSGFPLVLVSSTLNLWLKDSGLAYGLIGLFSLARTPYSFKWCWSPLIDRIRLPFFYRFGRRRGWALFVQLCLMLMILLMSQINPAENPWLMAFFAFAVVIFSASQDIVLDAYRIDSFEPNEQGAGTAIFVLGYRIGMLFSGAFALWLADFISWNMVYVIMSFGAVVGMITILLSNEPCSMNDDSCKDVEKNVQKNGFRLFIKESVVSPFVDFMKHKKWGWILLLVFLYRLSDEYKAPMAFPFYDDMGFSKGEIASISKIYGMIATIVGGIIGGIIISKIGLKKTLLVALVLQGLTNFVYIGQAYLGDNTYMLAFTICFDNIAGGMATTALVAYLSSLCSRAYTATQYALLSSLMSLSRDIVASTSGFVAEVVSWQMFFFISSMLMFPAVVLLVYMIKKKIIE